MIISAKKVLELNEEHKLIENISEREFNPEGVGIDVRVGKVYRMKGQGFLGVIERASPDVEKIADIDEGKGCVILNPGDYVLVKTIEKINLPSESIIIDSKSVHIMQDVYPRSILHRSGVQFIGTKTDPGYSGEMTYALKNIGNCPFKLELGARIANVIFKMVEGGLARSYGGQWQGGRVSTGGREKQI
jgi:deoxycytidine triphosphate deaminase